MTDKRPGPVEVRPNTLMGQSTPNTFGTPVDTAARSRQNLNSGGGNRAGPGRSALPRLGSRVYIALAVLVFFIAIYLLTATP